MERLKNIDILKTIGLLCIILAHVQPNKIVFQLRNFDVVLMIIISSYLFIKKNKTIDKLNLKYFIKRVKRLVLPTWIFLGAFFTLSSLIIQYDVKTIISTFLLHEGIGYVWIIRIYLIAAIILPILTPLLQKRITLLIVVVLYVCYEILAYLKIFQINIFMEDIVAYIMPVVLIITITHWIMNNNNKNVSIFGIINFSIFIVLFILLYKITGKIQNTNYMKYPFRLYYLSYAFSISSFLIILFRNEKLCDRIYNKGIGFISRSSLWIYFYHIPFVLLLNKIYPSKYMVIKFIIVIVFSIGITYFQNKVMDILENKGINKSVIQVFRG